MTTPHLSIVTTVYHSRPYLEQFIELCYEAVGEIECDDFELLCVIDGSPDDSLDFLKEAQQEHPEIVIVELSRNFGHHYAFHAGLRHARGEYIFLNDCDLEVSPLTLVEFYRDLIGSKYDVVYGYQERRNANPMAKYGGALFWKIFNFLSDTKVPTDVVTERLLTRRYVDALLELGDRNLFLAGMMYWVGFDQVGRPVMKKRRQGRSTYGLRRRWNLLVDAISSFSAVPLRLLFQVGLLITLGSVGGGTYFAIDKLINPETILLGWTSIIVILLFSLGVTLTSIGLVGIYLLKIFTQTQNRPLFIVKDIYRPETGGEE